MEVRIRSTGAVMLEDQLRRWLQETGGPSYETLTPEVMEAIGVDPVFEGPQATGGTVYQYSMRQGVEQQSDGKWYSKYVLGPVFTDNEDGTAAQQEAAYKAQKDAEQAASVRSDRDRRLAKTDWRVIKVLEAGSLQNFDWAAYRQMLRDVPSQGGFPWNVAWPTEPGA
jgi:hypothetical protein